MQLFNAGAQPHAEPLSAPQGDQGMRQLIGAALGVLQIPGIQVLKQDIATSWKNPYKQQEAAHQYEQQSGEHLSVDTADEKNAHRDGHDDHEVAQIGF